MKDFWVEKKIMSLAQQEFSGCLDIPFPHLPKYFLERLWGSLSWLKVSLESPTQGELQSDPLWLFHPMGALFGHCGCPGKAIGGLHWVWDSVHRGQRWGTEERTPQCTTAFPQLWYLNPQVLTAPFPLTQGVKTLYTELLKILSNKYLFCKSDIHFQI